MPGVEKGTSDKGDGRWGGAVETVPIADRQKDVLVSSRTRLRIAELISRRPRTLRELAKLTSLSVPGVLRHLEAMDKAGLIEEERLATRTLPVRKVYSLKGMKVVDFSVGDLSILKVTAVNSARRRKPENLEGLAMEILVGRRRIRDKARRLARSIDDQVENEGKLIGGIGDIGLTDEERLILEVLLTEETVEDGVRVLSRFYGVEDRRSIDEALSKARRNVK